MQFISPQKEKKEGISKIIAYFNYIDQKIRKMKGKKK